jgi:hypothetical protein
VTVAVDLFARYLRAGRLYGVGDEFWQAACDDLDDRELRRLARELGTNLPRRWATSRNGHREATPEAGLSVDISRSQPTGREAVSTPQNGSQLISARCAECGGQVAYLTRTGVCRRCQWRLSKRRRRVRDRSPAG